MWPKFYNGSFGPKGTGVIRGFSDRFEPLMSGTLFALKPRRKRATSRTRDGRRPRSRRLSPFLHGRYLDPPKYPKCSPTYLLFWDEDYFLGSLDGPECRCRAMAPCCDNSPWHMKRLVQAEFTQGPKYRENTCLGGPKVYVNTTYFEAYIENTKWGPTVCRYL